jgi:hypothetical protein
MLTKKAQLYVDRKKIKIKEIAEHRTAANPPQKPTHEAQCGGYAAVQSSDCEKSI